MESEKPPCRLPAQLTTASTPSSRGSQSSGLTAFATSKDTDLIGRSPLRDGLRLAARISWPPAAKRAQTAEPMKPVAPITKIRTTHLPEEQQVFYGNDSAGLWFG